MNRQIIRQGDVLLLPLASEPVGARRSIGADGQPLAGLRVDGERTGHAHVLPSRIYDTDAGRALFLERPTMLQHEEHIHIEVPAGWWEVRVQREHVPMEAPRGRFD